MIRKDNQLMTEMLFGPACPRCHRTDMLLFTKDTFFECLECRWIGELFELERGRQEAFSTNMAWIVIVICASLLAGVAGWLLRAWVRG